MNQITESRKKAPKNGEPAIVGPAAALMYMASPIPFARIPT
jgi:hypothetical protein